MYKMMFLAPSTLVFTMSTINFLKLMCMIVVCAIKSHDDLIDITHYFECLLPQQQDTWLHERITKVKSFYIMILIQCNLHG